MTLIELDRQATIQRRHRLEHPPGGRDSSELEIVTGPAERRMRREAADRAIAELKAATERLIRERRKQQFDAFINRYAQPNPLVRQPQLIVSYEMQDFEIEPRRPKIRDVQRAVCRHFNISLDDLLSQRRTAAVIRPRQIAMYLARALTLSSLPDIGRRFANRDHTTILHAVRKITALVETDADVADEIKLIRSMVEGGHG